MSGLWKAMGQMNKKVAKRSPRAPKGRAKKPAKIEIAPGVEIDDPFSPEFREQFPWTAGEMHDSYTSIESLLFSWFEKEGLDLGRGAVMDLAVRVSVCIEPFRSFYRAIEGWDGYDVKKCRQKAKLAEEKL